MKRALGCLMVLLVVIPAVAALTPARLEEIATKDVIPEIQMAAGLALVDYYAANKSAAELETLATGGATEAIREAATRALARVWVGAGKSYKDLLDLVNDPAQPIALRRAAIPALMEYLIAKKDSTLETLYTLGRTFEVRYAAAKAYFHNHRADYKTVEDVEPICLDDSKSDGFRKAAADLLAGLYLFPPTTAKSQAELEDMTLNAENEYISYAASVALATVLTKSDLSTTDLLKKVTSFYLNEAFTEEYKDAYIQALASRWAGEL